MHTFTFAPEIQASLHENPVVQSVLLVLRGATHFASLSPADLSALADGASLHSFATNRVVAAAGSSASVAALIVKGRMRAVRRSAFGRELTVETYRAGEIVVEGLFDNPGRLANQWKSGDNCLLLLLNKEALTAILRAHPEVSMSVMRDLDRQAGRAQALAAALALDDVESRLFRAISRFCREEGESCAEGTTIRRCPTQEELGSLIGARRETVSRLVAELARQGMVRLTGRKMLVTNRFLHTFAEARAA